MGGFVNAKDGLDQNLVRSPAIVAWPAPKEAREGGLGPRGDGRGGERFS